MQVRILAINDFHGQLGAGKVVGGRPAGGAAVLAAYLKKARAGREDRTIIVHAGDQVGASPPASALLQDEPAIQFFNLLGNEYCTARDRFHPGCNLAATVGNHEFDEGLDELRRLIRGGNHARGPFLEDPFGGAAFPYVAANVVDARSGVPLLPPLVIKRVQGLPIAFIGAVLKETPTMVTPAGVSGVRFLDEADAINGYLRWLPIMGVRAVVVLLHQGGRQTGYEGPTDPRQPGPAGPILDFVSRLEDEVDVVVTGHTHSFTNALLKNRNGKEILVTQAWAAGTAFAEIDLEIDRATRDVTARGARIVTTFADEGPGLTPDAQVAALVARAEARVAPLVSRVVGRAAGPITRARNSAGESALGNLIADAQRAALGTDFAFMNQGGIRDDLPAGEITWGALYTVQPFNNRLVRMDLSGRQIYRLLNRQWPPFQPYDRVLQVSGLTYAWDPSRPADERVVEVRRHGRPIDLDGVYTVTVNSFLAEGGDQFSVLTEGVGQVLGPVDLEALVQYLQGLPQPFSAAVEGRIEKIR
jgi:5'-nucleotidase